jgi:hypothetical protein
MNLKKFSGVKTQAEDNTSADLSTDLRVQYTGAASFSKRLHSGTKIDAPLGGSCSSSGFYPIFNLSKILKFPKLKLV